MCIFFLRILYWAVLFLEGSVVVVGERNSTNFPDAVYLQNLKDLNPPGQRFHLKLAVHVSYETFSSSLFSSNATKAVSFIGQSFNIINALWRQFSVAVYLSHMNIWNENIYERMPTDDWRENYPGIRDQAATLAENQLWVDIGYRMVDMIVSIRNYHAFEDVDEFALGNTYPNTACYGTQANNSGKGSIVTVRARHYNDSDSVAREMALSISRQLAVTFGAERDKYGDCSDFCVMANSNYSTKKILPIEWSSKSVKAVQAYLRNLPPLCMRQPPASLPHQNVSKWLFPICGNGILEKGEECDCGPHLDAFGTVSNRGVLKELLSKHFCSNPGCCHSKTCKLTKGAKCSNENCCNAKKCLPLAEGSKCRPSKHSECDVPEFCDGESHFCPFDRYAMPGTPCTDRFDSTCYKAACISRDQICYERLLGSHTLNMSVCYHHQPNPIDQSDKPGFLRNCGHTNFGTLEWTKPEKEWTVKHVYVPCNFSVDTECANLRCIVSSKDGIMERVRRPPSLLENHGKKRIVFQAFFWFSEYSPTKRTMCARTAGPYLPDFGLTPDGVLCKNRSRYCFNNRCQGILPPCDEPPCDQNGLPLITPTQESPRRTKSTTVQVTSDDNSETPNVLIPSTEVTTTPEENVTTPAGEVEPPQNMVTEDRNGPILYVGSCPRITIAPVIFYSVLIPSFLIVTYHSK